MVLNDLVFDAGFHGKKTNVIFIADFLGGRGGIFSVVTVGVEELVDGAYSGVGYAAFDGFVLVIVHK